MVAVGGISNGNMWRLAPCLVGLFGEADARDPDRDTTSDGTIGDAAHASRASDHNPALDPADGKWWVCAADIDDDDDQPSPGVHLLRQTLTATKDPRVKYLIHEGTIWKARTGFTPEVYTGLNAHKQHLHISVHNTAHARDDMRAWWPATPAPPDSEDFDMDAQEFELRLKHAEDRQNQWIREELIRVKREILAAIKAD